MTSALTETERQELVSYLLQIDNVALEDEIEPMPEPEPEPEPEPQPAAPTAKDAESKACAVRQPKKSDTGALLWASAFAALSLARRRRRS